MIKQKLGNRIDGWIHSAFPFLFIRPLNPNSLTVIGALGSLVAAAAFASGWFATGGILMLASGFFDLVAGVVARHNGVSTRIGQFLDAGVDEIMFGAIPTGDVEALQRVDEEIVAAFN